MNDKTPLTWPFSGLLFVISCFVSEARDPGDIGGSPWTRVFRTFVPTIIAGVLTALVFGSLDSLWQFLFVIGTHALGATADENDKVFLKDFLTGAFVVSFAWYVVGLI